MALFDKLNDFAKNVSEKANDAIETTKLNNKINTEKTAISDAMRQIGEYYYAKHTAGESTDPQIAELLSSIDSHQAAIVDVEAQITMLRDAPTTGTTPASSTFSGGILCPSCGKQNPAGTKFCCDCGGKLDAFSTPQERICPSCGTSIKVGIKFCTECGTRMDA